MFDKAGEEQPGYTRLMLQVELAHLGTTAAWVRNNLFFHLVIHTRLVRQHLPIINITPPIHNTSRANNIPPWYTNTPMPTLSTRQTCRTVSSVTIGRQYRSIRLAGRRKMPGHCLPVILSITKWVVSHVTSLCHVTLHYHHHDPVVPGQKIIILVVTVPTTIYIITTKKIIVTSSNGSFNGCKACIGCLETCKSLSLSLSSPPFSYFSFLMISRWHLIEMFTM